MTREELYQSIYTHDTVYIPPHEADSAALEVTLGCSWHKCTFCDFARDKFCIHPLEKLEHDIQILSALRPDADSLFCWEKMSLFLLLKCSFRFLI